MSLIHHEQSAGRHCWILCVSNHSNESETPSLTIIGQYRSSLVFPIRALEYKASKAKPTKLLWTSHFKEGSICLHRSQPNNGHRLLRRLVDVSWLGLDEDQPKRPS